MKTHLVVNRFLNHLRRDGKSVLTLSAYSTDLKQLLLHTGDISFSSPAIKREIEDFQKSLSSLALNSQARKLTSVRELLNWSYQQGYTEQDLSNLITLPHRISQKPAKPLSKIQISRIRRHTNPCERLLVELLLQTGLRMRDVVRLKFPLTNNRLPITPHLRQALDYYLSQYEGKLKNFLLVTQKGKQFSVRNANILLRQLSKKSGVRSLTPRNLRTTFIVRQLEAGTPISTVAQAVGHKTLSTTQSYTKFRPMPSTHTLRQLVDI